MPRKRLLLTLIPILAVTILVLVFFHQTEPVVSHIPLTDSESRISRALGADIIAKFEVNHRLPAGTTITHWVEFYHQGMWTDLAWYSEVLFEAASNFPIVVTATREQDHEKWSVSVGNHSKYDRAPYTGYHTGMLRTISHPLRFAEPMTLALGVATPIPSRCHRLRSSPTRTNGYNQC